MATRWMPTTPVETKFTEMSSDLSTALNDSKSIILLSYKQPVVNKFQNI